MDTCRARPHWDVVPIAAEKRRRKAAKLRGRIAPHGIEIEREPDGRYVAALGNAAVYGDTRHAAIENLRAVLTPGAKAADVRARLRGIWPLEAP